MNSDFKTSNWGFSRSGRAAAVWAVVVGLVMMSDPVFGQVSPPLHISAGHPILNEFGAVIEGDSTIPRNDRPLVHVLKVGAQVLPPLYNGTPQNEVVDESRIGSLVSPAVLNSGLFGAALADTRPANGTELFVRVYNSSTIADSLFYAESTNLMVAGVGSLSAYMGGMTNIINAHLDTDGDGLPDWWEHLNFAGDRTGANPNVDYDGDGMTAGEEYIAGTHPLDAASTFIISAVAPVHSNSEYEDYVWVDEDPESPYFGDTFTTRVYEVIGKVLSWPSVDGRLYRLEYTTNLLVGGYEQLPGASNLWGTPPFNVYTNYELMPDDVPILYRARVRMAD